MFFKRSNYRVAGTLAANAQASRNEGDTVYSFFGCVVSDAGCVRPQNEDNYLFLGQCNQLCQGYSRLSGPEHGPVVDWQLAAVFDGISSARAGLSAAEAVRIFQNSLPALEMAGDKDAAAGIVRSTFQEANDHIFRKNMGGTTATALCMDRRMFKLFHLGDSRAYLYRNGNLSQLTRDQTLEQLKRDAGLYDPEDTGTCADSHILTDYLGRDQGGYPVESHWIPIQEGDHMILCSDGLYGLCADTEMTRILSAVSGPEAQAQTLVDAAREAGGTDNITCMVIRFYETKRGGNRNGCV